MELGTLSASIPRTVFEPALSPATVCDVMLDAAIASDIDMIWIEPRATAEDRYDVSMERRGRVVTATSLDGSLGAAVIARLAMIAEIDLIGRRACTGRCLVRGPSASAEIVVTTRPGRTLRAEILIRRPAARGSAAPLEPVVLTPGTAVGHYRIAERLGAGGMGEVFRVTHSTLGRHFALKVLNGAARPDAEAVANFLREARAAARIKHPHIVDVFDFGHLADGRPYLLMELLAGHSLAAAIASGELDVRTAIMIARQLASALGAAHQVGVIHADVSPSNVLVVGDSAKLVDFGLAQLRDDPARFDPEHPAEFVFGTPSYIAPEMIRGLGAVEASDQYSLGVVLYEMLTGEPPYKSKTIRDVCLQHLRDPVPRLTLDDGPAPAELSAVVERCLAKRPEQRFPSMAAMDAALGEAEHAMSARGWRRWLS